MERHTRYLSHSAVLSASWQWCCNNTINLASLLWAPTLQPHWDEECWSTTFSVIQWTTSSVSVWTIRCWDCSRTRTRKRCIHSTHPHSQTWQNTISRTSESTSVNFSRKNCYKGKCIIVHPSSAFASEAVESWKLFSFVSCLQSGWVWKVNAIFHFLSDIPLLFKSHNMMIISIFNFYHQ